MFNTICFILLIAFIEVIHYKERKELCSRIQAKDLREYKAVEEPKKKKKEEDKPPVQFL